MKTNELPLVLETKLADFRRRVWIVKLTEGVLAACFGLALSYVVVFALDRVMETPVWLRATILISGAAVLGLGLPLKWHRWVWGQRSLEAAAKLLRRKMPRLGDQLLGIVELSRAEGANTGRSETLVRAAMAQAADSVKDKDFTHAVPQARHRSWAWAAGAVVVLCGVAFAVVNDAARNAMLRWLMPWKNTERYTFARVQKLPDTLVVPYAEKFEMPVALSADTHWAPEQGKARMQGQPTVTAPLGDNQYPLAFPPQKNDTKMSLSVGDVRAKITVEPRTRPELTSLAAHLKLPDYLKYTTQPSMEIRGGNVSLLKGAEVSFVASASRELAKAEMDGAAQKIEGDKIVTAFDRVQDSGDHRFQWRDTLGLQPREPLVLKVQAVEDEAPRIVARRDTQETVVLDSEVVAFDVSAQDDFGIKRVGLEWAGEKKITSDEPPAKGEKTAMAGAPEKRDADGRATFSAMREGVAPQTLQVRAWVEDYLPGRKRSYSQTFILHVLNKQDHALWLTEQFGKWLQTARESYEREQQLHQSNKELRSLSPEELDRPENRRKVMQQAAAERMNSERLDNITQLGKNLVEQATRNDEFDAKRLESWATMLKSLRQIAAERMPSVADLLKQTSNAATKNTAQNGASKPGEPKSSQNSQASNPQNNSQKKPEGESNQSKQPSNPSGPKIENGEQLAQGKGKASETDPDAKQPKPAPGIADREGGSMKPVDAEQGGAPTKKKPGGGKLTLPQTQLAAAPGGKKPEEQEQPPESPAQETMEKAIWEQRDLLAEFAKVADQLSEIMASLEASTFVKRLKAASKAEMTLATELNEKTLSAFGLEKKDVTVDPAKHVSDIASRGKNQSETVNIIQGDLEAYFQRRQDARFKNILDQMKKTEIVNALLRTSERTGANLSGRGISSSEFWADTLDRWAEEMVAAAQCSECKGGSSDSLPPEIVLMVMQALRDEMKLRDETREMENAKPAIGAVEHKKRTEPLARKQERNASLVMSAFDQILLLPQGGQKFGKELKLLDAVKQVMDEASGILDKPDTGPEAIAAETEAIELLLQAKRQKPGGGGGGSDPGGGGGSATAGEMSLAELGPGADSAAKVASRPVGQETGKAGREFPEEFKSGLDSYFNKLESHADKP